MSAKRVRKDTIGAHVRETRRHRKETLDEVARSLGIAKSSLWAIEQEKTTDPRLTTALLLMNYCGLEIEQICYPE